MYLLISTLMYQGLERSSDGWYTRLVVRILSIIPFSYASSNFLNPLVKRPNVVAQNTLLAPRFLSSEATSIILSPEEIISSMMITSFPSTLVPRNSCATIGLRPLTILV